MGEISSIFLAVIIIIVFMAITIAFPLEKPATEFCYSAFSDKNIVDVYCNIWGTCTCEYLDVNGFLVKQKFERIDKSFYLVK